MKMRLKCIHLTASKRISADIMRRKFYIPEVALSKIEDTCKKYMKPYMVVTQMLASMEERPIPTRAEVSDIFHATFHGAKAVMVTGETAVGKYPREVISYLASTAMEGAMHRKNLKNNVENC